jgi:hypothetical protein
MRRFHMSSKSCQLGNRIKVLPAFRPSKNIRINQCAEFKGSPAKLTPVPTILLAILWQSYRLKKFVNVMHQTFLDRCRDICVSSQIDDFHILVHAVFICCIYCTISFNSAVMCHGAPKNAEMSCMSRRFSWYAEFIWQSCH